MAALDKKKRDKLTAEIDKLETLARTLAVAKNLMCGELLEAEDAVAQVR
jgi:hypothetical protein